MLKNLLFWDIPNQSKRLEGLLDQARELGIPVERGQMAAYEPVPDEQNLLPVFNACFPALSRALGEHSDLRNRIRNTSLSGNTAETAMLLEPFNEALDTIASARDRPFFRPDHQLDYPQSADLGTYHDSIHLAGLFHARAMVQFLNGHFDEALQSIRTIGRLCALYDREPFMVWQLVRTATQTILFDLLARYSVFAARQNESVLDALSIADEHLMESDWLRMLLTEAYWEVQTYRNLDRLGGMRHVMRTAKKHQLLQRPMDPARIEDLPANEEYRAYMTQGVAYWLEMVQAWSTLNGDCISHAKLAYSRYKERGRSMLPSNRGFCIDVRVLRDSSVGIKLASARNLLNREGIAVLAHKEATGSFPKTLDVLGPPCRDPISHRAVLYELDQKGFRLSWKGIRVHRLTSRPIVMGGFIAVDDNPEFHYSTSDRN